MPARTLSEDSELLSPLRYAPFVQSPPLLDHPEQYTMDLAMRAEVVTHFYRSRQRTQERGHVYPTPPPMQRTDWRAHPAMSSQWPPNPSLSPGWLPHPPVTNRVLAPPPMHKVWLVDCKTCGMFLTNRGMKAVLLLHPSVPLYSTDAMPINCSAQAMTAEATASSSSRARAASLNDTERPRSAARTCDCLTQTLWCHGCGTAAGYMIVTPCVRCTSSVAPNNRSTNGHRFVFYSAEIVASERHYVPGEGGIITETRVVSIPRPVPVLAETQPGPQFPTRTGTLHGPGDMIAPPQLASNPHIPSPYTPNPYLRYNAPSTPTSPRSPVEPSSPRSDATSSPPPLAPITPPRNAMAPPPQIETIHLREGDVVFWHHLVRSGEISAVVDDPRARAPAHEAKDAKSDLTKTEKQETTTASRKMVFGR